MHVHVDYPKGLEKMNHLFIVGNGFDIAHGIPSRYLDFKKWLEENQEEVYYKMIEYFPDVANDNLEWWSDFENNLDTLSAHEAIYRNAAEYYPDFGSDDFRDADYHRAGYEIKQEITNLYNEIQESFDLWVKQLGIPQKNYRFNLPPETFYLTFNYTDTLQNLYGISSDKIFYIHGRAAIDDPLIFGHAGNYQHIEQGTESSIPGPPDNLEPDEYEQWYEQNADDYSVSSAREEAKRAIYEFHKPTHELITKYRIFFGRCGQIETITILGLAFSEVDKPYLYTIFNNLDISRVKIIICYYSEKDLNAVKAFIGHFDIPSENLSIIHTHEYPHKEYITPMIPHLFDD